MTTWWDEHNRSLESGHPGVARGLLPAHVVTLLNDVEARFVATSTVPGWPDPHAGPSLPWPGHRSPDEAEYSCVTDAGRYRVLHERAAAWLAELATRDLATVEQVSLEGVWLLGHDHHPEERVQRAVPRRPGALPLVFESWAGGNDLPAGVRIGAGNPAVLLDRMPFCGCDACDDGSFRLLQHLDEWCVRVLDGSMHLEVTPDHTTIRFSDGSTGVDIADTTDSRARRAALGPDLSSTRGVPWDPSWPPREPIES